MEIKTIEEYILTRIQDLENENDSLREKLEDATAEVNFREEHELKAMPLLEYAKKKLFEDAFTGTGYASDVRDYSREEDAFVSFNEFVTRNVRADKLPESMSVQDFTHICEKQLNKAYDRALIDLRSE